MSAREATSERPHRFIDTGMTRTPVTISTNSRYGPSTTQAMFGSIERNATTAGIVWITSPSAESRRTRMPDGRVRMQSLLRTASHSLQDLRRRVLFRVPDDDHPAAIGTHHIGLGYRIRCVVCPFAMHVGLQRAEEATRAAFMKDRDVRHAADRRDQLGTLALVHHRTPLAFECSDRLISVDPDDEHVRLLGSVLQVADMTHVEHVEAAVRERNRLPIAPDPLDGFHQLRFIQVRAVQTAAAC